MTQTVYDWLPIEALACPAVSEPVEQVVGAWSRDWFSRHGVSVSELKPAPAVLQNGDEDWLALGGAISTSVSRSAITRLVSWALDARLPEEHQAPADRAVLARFERKLFQDLLRSLEAAFGVSSPSDVGLQSVATPFDQRGGVLAPVEDSSGTRLLTVAIPYAAAFKKARPVSPSRAGSAPLIPLARALAPTGVKIQAGLGQADVSLAELQRLAPGDVLILDRDIEAPADITLSGGDLVIAHAELTEIDGHVGLRLQA